MTVAVMSVSEYVSDKGDVRGVAFTVRRRSWLGGDEYDVSRS